MARLFSLVHHDKKLGVLAQRSYFEAVGVVGNTIFQTDLPSPVQEGRNVDKMTLKVPSTSVILSLFPASSLFRGGFSVVHPNRQFPRLCDYSISCRTLSI